MTLRLAAIGFLTAASLAVAPVTPASAHGFRHHGFPIIGGLFAAGAVVGAAAVAVATAPVRIIANAAAPTYYVPPAAYAYPPYGYRGAPVAYAYPQPVYAYPAQAYAYAQPVYAYPPQ